MPLTDDELLASNPDAAMLIAAGVPREEVLKNLRMTAETSGPLKGVIMRADRSRFASSVLPLGAVHISAVAALGTPLASHHRKHPLLWRRHDAKRNFDW